jgi:vacuolar-type H+-ATPase subunit F/Vma7
MKEMKSIDIAIIGSKDQTALMRLAGLETYRVIEEDDPNITEKVRSALKELSQDPSIGIIMIPDNWIEYVADLLKSIRESKRVSTVVLEIPSKYTMDKQNVKEYYKSYTRRLIGFNIEL